jgi:hypothetical protein
MPEHCRQSTRRICMSGWFEETPIGAWREATPVPGATDVLDVTDGVTVALTEPDRTYVR